MRIFKDEILVRFSGLEIAWYPSEKICLVSRNKSTRAYRNIPKKYKVLFSDTGIKVNKFKVKKKGVGKAVHLSEKGVEQAKPVT